MKNLLVGIILGALIAMVNSWSFEDELKQQKLYCEMNSGGLWYDSPERYAKICPAQSGTGASSPAMGQHEGADSKAPVILTF